MTVEEIITGISCKEKNIHVSFSVYINDKYLEFKTPNYSQILENIFEAFIKQKVILLELSGNKIQNITLTEKSAKGFELRHLENNIKIKSGFIESFRFTYIEELYNQFGIKLKIKKTSAEFYIPKYENNILEWTKIIAIAFSEDKPISIEYIDGGLVYNIKME
jgi:hypothetical protein